MSSTTALPPVHEGLADFDYPAAGKPLRTWYKITGDFTATSIPLIILHGGPGVGSEAYNPLSDLAHSHSYSIPIIQYDQIGCKRSTDLENKADAGAEFWNEDLFIAQLYSLIANLGLDAEGRQYDIIGHSWGAMFGTTFASQRPKGLRRYIIWSSAGSMSLWLEAANKLKKTLPDKVQEVIDRCENEGKTDSSEYQEAMNEYYAQYMCRLDPIPDEIMDGLIQLGSSSTYPIMWGPSEFKVTGTLKKWSALEQISKINVPVLLLNGQYDEAQDSCMISFFDRLEKVKWVRFAQSAHMAHFEERERFMQVVGDFLMK